MTAKSGERCNWRAFESRRPDLASAGRALLEADGGVAIGFLATASTAGRPHLSPVCPIFCGDHVYLSIGAPTPKRRDLDEQGRYALHAFLGADDAEFQFAGTAERVDSPAERERVHEAIRFSAFRRADPIYRLWLEQCLYVCWENVGRPDTRAVRRGWTSGERLQRNP